jgi:DNA polymerase III subunit delta'
MTLAAPAVGVSGPGQLPLPWLGDAWRDAAALRQAHALLLVGPSGAGHLELALLLAQATLCERPAGQGWPCGQCGSCHLLRQRSHPDLLVLLPDAMRVQFGWLADDETRLAKADTKPSRELRVAQVRDAIGWGQQTSSRGRGKVLVMHPADALNAVAANALLKTLEEPPGTLRLLLTSVDAERLLPTVRSRCQRVALALPASSDAIAWLQAQGLAEPAPWLALAAGSPVDALAWASEGINADWLAQMPRRVASGDASVLAGRPVPRALDLLLKLAHDAQVLAVGGAPRFFATASLPAGADLPALVAWQRQLLRVARHDEHPWNAGLLIESLVGQATDVWPAPIKGAAGGHLRGPRPSGHG